MIKSQKQKVLYIFNYMLSNGF